MSFQAGESLADDAEAIMGAHEALTEENYSATDTFSNAAAVTSLMLEDADGAIAEAEEQGEGDSARETKAALETMTDGLTQLAEGDVPDNVDDVRGHLGGLAQAYAMRMLEAQLAAALGGA